MAGSTMDPQPPERYPDLPVDSFLVQLRVLDHEVRRQLLRLVERRGEFRSTVAEVAAINRRQSQIQLFDVGGAPFHVGTDALQGAGGEHLLSILASDQFTREADGDGYVFLDRDSEWFGTILAHLRATGPSAIPCDRLGRRALGREAKYYGLDELHALACPSWATSEIQERPLMTRMPHFQPHVNPNMRQVLVDWLVEVCGDRRFRLSSAILFLGVDILDRFLDEEPLEIRSLQLAGAAALKLVADQRSPWGPDVRGAKPTMADYVYIMADAYTAQEVEEMTGRIRRRLGLLLVDSGGRRLASPDLAQIPTVHLFLERALLVTGANFPPTQHLANYIAESSLLRYESLQ